MESSENIEHKGVIKAVNGDIVTVKLENVSACGSCHSRQACGISDNSQKVVEVKNTQKQYMVGDSVTVSMDRSIGYKALFLGYLLPFLVLIAGLFTVSRFSDNEIIYGTVAIGALIVYYIVLFFFRNKLKESFTFRIIDKQ